MVGCCRQNILSYRYLRTMMTFLLSFLNPSLTQASLELNIMLGWLAVDALVDFAMARAKESPPISRRSLNLHSNQEYRLRMYQAHLKGTWLRTWTWDVQTPGFKFQLLNGVLRVSLSSSLWISLRKAVGKRMWSHKLIVTIKGDNIISERQRGIRG